ncbi:hypothetical protein Tco_1440570 [Tanacetum coccineum]
MASQDARLSKFEAGFKQQQSEMANKIDTVLKAITDRMAGALPGDTVKNPKLNVNTTTSVLSARSYPTEDQQCSTHIHGSINAVIIHPKQQSNSHDDEPAESEEEEKDSPENTNTNPSASPNPSVSFITEKVLKLNSFFKSLALAPQLSGTEFGCTKGDDGDVMFIEIVKKNDDSRKEEPKAGGLEVEYFDIFLTQSELAYHKYLMCGPIPSIFLRNPIITEGCLLNLKIPCNIMRRKLNPKENSDRGVSNFTRMIKGIHVFIGNFTYAMDFMIVEDISSIIDPRLSQVVLGKPFIDISNITHDPLEGVVRFTNGTDEVAYKMPQKIEQYNSLSDLEKEHTRSVYLKNEEDKRKGVDLLDVVRITAAHVCVNTTQLELVLLRDLKEKYVNYDCSVDVNAASENMLEVTIANQDSTHMVAASKVPMLKPGEYEIWRMRIEQYIQMIDYALWEVIENVMPITTAEEKAQRRLEVKERSNLMMAIPNEHQLKFNSINDAKKLLKDVEKRFGMSSQVKHTEPCFCASLNKQTSSTNGAVNTAHRVSTASTQVNAANSTNIDNLSNAVIYKFVNKLVVENYKAMSIEEEHKVVRKNDDAPCIKEWVSNNDEEDVSQPKTEKKIVRPSIVKNKFVKSKQQEKSARKTVKQVEQHRQNTHSPRGNQINWNNMMSQKLGSIFEMFNKA